MFGFGLVELIELAGLILFFVIVYFVIKIIINYKKNKRKLQDLAQQDAELTKKTEYLKNEIDKISK